MLRSSGRILRLGLPSFSREPPRPQKYSFPELLELKEQKMSVNLPEHLMDEKKNEEGVLMHHRVMEDDMFLRAYGYNEPGVERRSASYTLVKDGKRYHVFNAERKLWGEVINRASVALIGKHKPTFRRNVPSEGDIVVVVNVDKILMKDKRLKTHGYHYHTGAPGGLKKRLTSHLMFHKPEALFIRAVFKQLPKTKLRYTYLKNLHVNAGPLPKEFSFLPGFTDAPHFDRSKILDFSIDPADTTLIHDATDEPLRRVISPRTQRPPERPPLRG